MSDVGGLSEEARFDRVFAHLDAVARHAPAGLGRPRMADVIELLRACDPAVDAPRVADADALRAAVMHAPRPTATSRPPGARRRLVAVGAGIAVAIAALPQPASSSAPPTCSRRSGRTARAIRTRP